MWESSPAHRGVAEIVDERSPKRDNARRQLDRLEVDALEVRSRPNVADPQLVGRLSELANAVVVLVDHAAVDRAHAQRPCRRVYRGAEDLAGAVDCLQEQISDKLGRTRCRSVLGIVGAPCTSIDRL